MNSLHRWICRSSWWRRHVERDLLPWALNGLPLGDDILEVGPGPGLTTDRIREMVVELTVLEIDPVLAKQLRDRMNGQNVTVVQGDGTAMPFENETFSAVLSFTMLHHVPSVDLQDQLLGEACRVLKPGGFLAGTDSLWGPIFALAHIGDTMVLSEPNEFQRRLRRAGFGNIQVEPGRRAFRFRAQKPSCSILH